jgi:demethoxyubiquinone hydroxylase (CLK1/Coq7/Cat5 family)
MLQKAHAAEWAAYHAYEGHWRSVSDEEEREEIRSIASEELSHIGEIKAILKKFNSQPSERRDRIYTYLGFFIGFLCHHTGRYWPMRIAQLMERIGSSAYKDIAEEAYREGHIELYNQLLVMQKTEEVHEEYFRGKR